MQQRNPIVHKVKSWPKLFQAAVDGKKLHDVRFARENDFVILSIKPLNVV